MNLNSLMEKAEWKELTEKEIAFVIQNIHNDDANCSYDTLCNWIFIFGRAGPKTPWVAKYQKLLENYFYYPAFPQVSGNALKALALQWGLASEYLDKIKLFIKGVDWDISNEVRLEALNVSGAYLRYYEDKELLKLILDFYTRPETFENNDALSQGAAYITLARAVGRKWEQIPPAYEQDESTVNRSPLLDSTLIQEVYQRLNSTEFIRSFCSLMEEAGWKELTEKEVAFVIQNIHNDDANCSYDTLCNWIFILGRAGVNASSITSHRKLLENYLYYPAFPDVSADALRSLDFLWGATEYIDQIKLFIKGVDWDLGNDVRHAALSVAGEFLRNYEDKALLQLILDFYTKPETFENNNAISQGAAYEALARAIGREWEQIPRAYELDELIENHSPLLDPVIVQEAYQRITFVRSG